MERESEKPTSKEICKKKFLIVKKQNFKKLVFKDAVQDISEISKHHDQSSGFFNDSSNFIVNHLDQKNENFSRFLKEPCKVWFLYFN